MADLSSNGEAALASGWTAVIIECMRFGKMESPRAATMTMVLFLFLATISLLFSSHNPNVNGGNYHIDYK